jgi:aminoglycoside 3-N-acetyltransferase
MQRPGNPADPTHQLVTRRDLARDLHEIGVRRGQTLLVHASVRSIGLAVGGAAVILAALQRAVGPAGNIVVPTGTAENSVTSRAHRALIAEMTVDEISAFRLRMQGFDKDITPSTTGALGEAVRNKAGAVRSAHPQSSFAAIGRDAADLMAGHRVECHLGEDSPLAKLYAMKASVLLLGVGYQTCSAFHLAEYRYVDPPPMTDYWCAVLVDGHRHWINYEDVVLDDRDFPEIGEELEKEALQGHGEAYVKIAPVGQASSRLISMVHAVDYARDWMAKHRV